MIWNNTSVNDASRWIFVLWCVGLCTHTQLRPSFRDASISNPQFHCSPGMLPSTVTAKNGWNQFNHCILYEGATTTMHTTMMDVNYCTSQRLQEWFHISLVDSDLAINSMMWQHQGLTGAADILTSEVGEGVVEYEIRGIWSHSGWKVNVFLHSCSLYIQNEIVSKNLGSLYCPPIEMRFDLYMKKHDH